MNEKCAACGYVGNFDLVMVGIEKIFLTVIKGGTSGVYSGLIKACPKCGTMKVVNTTNGG